MNKENSLHINHSLRFIDGTVSVDGEIVYQQNAEENYIALSKRIFKEVNKSYSKYHKMDRVSKLAFLSSELLLKMIDLEEYNLDNVATIFSNSSSTIETDTKFQNSISEIPSPAIFVYTLPNIMVGEICIRYKFKGENLFFVEPTLNTKLLVEQAEQLFANSGTELCLVGWVDFYNTEDYACYMALISNNKQGTVLSEENLNSQFKITK